MIVSLNFVISLVAFCLAIRAYHKGKALFMFSLFLLLVGSASLVGGWYHLMLQNEATSLSIIATINHHLPQLIQINFDQLQIRLWYLTVVIIGGAECSFFFLLKPLLTGKLKYLEYYFLCMLGIFMVANLLVDHYLVVVSFHVITQTIFIVISFYCYFTSREKRLLWLPLLAFYNIGSGLAQQLMKHGYMPTGPLNYNDWYHLLIIIFLLLCYYVMVTKNVAVILEATAPREVA